jgi:hypothetical protein
VPKVDYAAIEERDFTPVEDGIYEARLTNWELIPAKSDDKFPYYNCEFTASADAGVGNRKFWKILSLSPQALWAFKKDMISMGADPEDMSPGSEVDTDDIIAGCMEAPCRLVLKKEIYPKRDGTEGERSSIVEVLSALPF